MNSFLASPSRSILESIVGISNL
uniref:Uncharacterized protein n=1 Tax=Arundo donax TaxID=35708 RepID=A0A0A8ZZJ6_ARUDO